MKNKSWLHLFIFACLPVADVGSMLILAKFVGVVPTLLLVLLSSLVGLVACGRYLRKFKVRSDHFKEKYRGDIPREIQLVNANDAIVTLILMFMFMFPGLLSDLVAFVFLIPRFQQGFFKWYKKKLEATATAQGKTLEEFLTPKCEIKG